MSASRLTGWLLAGLLWLPPLLSPARADTLAAALEQAWARHPEAVALAARAAEADARGELADSLTPGPASLSLGYLGDSLSGDRGKREWEVELAAPLWLPGQQAARRDEAAGAVAQVTARRAALRLQIAGAVREAGWAVAAARNAFDLSRRRVESARALEADVLRRFDAGDLARVDANLARGERLAAEAEMTEAEIARLEAEQAWRNLTGAPAPDVLAAEVVRSLLQSSPEAAAEHPRLVAAAATARVAQAGLRVVEATRRDAPELALRLVRDRGDAGESYANSLGVQLTVPFSSGPRLRLDNAAARAQLAEADAELALARHALTLDMEKARAELAAVERRLAMAREHQAFAADNLRLAEKAFALGESDLTTLLRIRATAFEAEAFLDRQRVAQAAAQSRLNQVMGVLP